MDGRRLKKMEEDGRRWKKMMRKKQKNKIFEGCWGWSGDLSWGTIGPENNNFDLVTTIFQN